MTYIPRSISPAIEEATKFFPVIVVTGPRQSGKSTLVKHLFSDFACFNLEDLDTREIARSDPRAFLAAGNSGMIIDEAHRVPELFSYIQGIVDNNPHAKFILTGSAQLSLIERVGQSLAGRAAIFQLLPLSWDELAPKMKSGDIDTVLFKGFYPALITRGIPPSLYYSNYVRTYLERDVRTILNIRDLDVFQRFLRLTAARIGSLWIAKDLSDDLGVSVNTIRSWISVLQATYIVYLLPPYFSNIEKRLVKTPKIYFYDTGLAAYLLSIDSPAQMNVDKMRGHLFENFIITEALKKTMNLGKDPQCFFYRDSNAVEVDLIERMSGRLKLFEIKSSSTFHTSFEKNLNRVSAILKEEISDMAVIYTGPDTYPARSPMLLNTNDFFEYI